MLTDPTDLPLGPADAATPPASRLQPGVLSRAVLTVLFTGVQAWAITIAVRYVHVGAMERAALAAALAAAALAVLDSWRDVWGATRTDRPEPVWAAATAGPYGGVPVVQR